MEKPKTGYIHFPEITTKQWEEADGQELDADVIREKRARIGTYETELIEITHDGSDGYAILRLGKKDSARTDFEVKNGRYDLQDGYYIFIQGIFDLPEERVHIEIKKKYKKQ